MNLRGTQIYSYQIIEEIVRDDDQADFALEILEVLPEYVKKSLLEKIEMPDRIGKLKQIQLNKQMIIKQKKLSLESKFLKILNTYLNQKKFQEIENKKKELLEDYKNNNPYKQKSFNKERITVEKLFAFIDGGDTCKYDGAKYKEKQIVAKYENGKSYGMILKCCTKCKRIIIEPEKINGIESNLEKFNIEHIFIGESEKE